MFVIILLFVISEYELINDDNRIRVFGDIDDISQMVRDRNFEKIDRGIISLRVGI